MAFDDVDLKKKDAQYGSCELSFIWAILLTMLAMVTLLYVMPLRPLMFGVIIDMVGLMSIIFVIVFYFCQKITK